MAGSSAPAGLSSPGTPGNLCEPVGVRTRAEHGKGGEHALPGRAGRSRLRVLAAAAGGGAGREGRGPGVAPASVGVPGLCKSNVLY